ncbi:MAG: choice-of-anchor Q domain-containing protein [Anaerolineales bacterium]|jgi:hypothetical protein
MGKKTLSWGLIVILAMVLSRASFFHQQSALAAGPWFVAPGGNNGNTCTAVGSECATINGALGKANSGDTIYVAIGTYTGAGSEVVYIDKNITLSGGWDIGFTDQIGTSVINGQDSRRVIEVAQGITVTIELFTVQSGNADGAAGIHNQGALTLDKCTIRDNFDSGDWTSEGGGIRNSDQGTLTVKNSTISGNESSSGAGIFNAWGTIVVENSTISGNTARGSGGGINNLGGSAYLYNVTVSNNTDQGNVAGGIHNEGGGSVYLENSIIAGNNASIPDCNGTIISQGYNLVGNTSTCTFTPSVGDYTNLDPMLTTLEDNGGSTSTHALQFSSPAINGGDPLGCRDHLDNPLISDQRGFPRVQRCDIGAFEFQTEISHQYLPIILKPIYHADNFDDDNLDLTFWSKINDTPGVSIQETAGEIRITGTSNDSLWGWNGLRTAEFPMQSFQVSVDLHLVNRTGGDQESSLRLLFNNGNHYFRVGYWDPDDSYFVGFKDDGGWHHVGGIPAFGDEGTAFHTLKIEFDSSTNTARGYVDQVQLGSFSSGIFTSPMYIAFVQSSQIPGNFNVDCHFDNFVLSTIQ